LTPRLDAAAFDEIARSGPNNENPELFRTKEAFPEFPKERHRLSFRRLFPNPRDVSAAPPWLKFPKELQPPRAVFPEMRADASMDRPVEFPNDCHLPIVVPVPRTADSEAPKRPKLLEAAEDLKLPPPRLELRAKLPDGREENPSDFAYEATFIRPLFMRPPSR
jgi:hypothetical protein